MQEQFDHVDNTLGTDVQQAALVRLDAAVVALQAATTPPAQERAFRRVLLAVQHLAEVDVDTIADATTAAALVPLRDDLGAIYPARGDVAADQQARLVGIPPHTKAQLRSVARTLDRVLTAAQQGQAQFEQGLVNTYRSTADQRAAVVGTVLTALLALAFYAETSASGMNSPMIRRWMNGSLIAQQGISGFFGVVAAFGGWLMRPQVIESLQESVARFVREGFSRPSWQLMLASVLAAWTGFLNSTEPYNAMTDESYVALGRPADYAMPLSGVALGVAHALVLEMLYRSGLEALFRGQMRLSGAWSPFAAWNIAPAQRDRLHLINRAGFVIPAGLIGVGQAVRTFFNADQLRMMFNWNNERMAPVAGSLGIALVGMAVMCVFAYRKMLQLAQSGALFLDPASRAAYRAMPAEEGAHGGNRFLNRLLWSFGLADCFVLGLLILPALAERTWMNNDVVASLVVAGSFLYIFASFVHAPEFIENNRIALQAAHTAALQQANGLDHVDVEMPVIVPANGIVPAQQSAQPTSSFSLARLAGRFGIHSSTPAQQPYVQQFDEMDQEEIQMNYALDASQRDAASSSTNMLTLARK